MLVLFLAILSNIYWAEIEESEPILPSSNYWNLVQELIVTKQIDVSPIQTIEIRKIGSAMAKNPS